MNSVADALRVDHIHVWRGDRHVLRGVSLALRPGELLHVSGPNGTGKTTLVRVVTGLLRPEQGGVTWQGESIVSARSHYQQMLAFASHEPALKGDLTAHENLQFAVGLRRPVGRGELAACLERTGVAACASLPARVLSAGQRRRVVMARVLASRAPLWVLDEPFTNLDTDGAALVTRLLAEHVDAGGMALVVAHQELEVAGRTRRLSLAP